MISLTSPVKTRAHRWPAGVKLGLLCAATVILFMQQNIAFQAAAFAGTAAIYFLPGTAFARAGARAVWRLWPFVVLVAVWHLIVGAGEQGAIIVLRMLTAVALANLVTMTTSLSQMIAAVMWLAAHWPLASPSSCALHQLWRTRERR